MISVCNISQPEPISSLVIVIAWTLTVFILTLSVVSDVNMPFTQMSVTMTLIAHVLMIHSCSSDINECTQSFHSCLDSELCVNTIGGYECKKKDCDPGFVLDLETFECEGIFVFHRLPFKLRDVCAVL